MFALRIVPTVDGQLAAVKIAPALIQVLIDALERRGKRKLLVSIKRGLTGQSDSSPPPAFPCSGRLSPIRQQLRVKVATACEDDPAERFLAKILVVMQFDSHK